MGQIPNHISNFLSERQLNNSLRKLSIIESGIDFISNDYLGFSKSGVIASIFNDIHKGHDFSSGSTGSRLISGNSKFKIEIEQKIARIHKSESALVFNSGYDANVGLFSSLPQKNDLVITDELIHASIIDGIRLSFAKHYKFKHNDIEDLKDLINRHHQNFENIYLAVESVYSMDGDEALLMEIANELKNYSNVYLIIDEAHAIGVFGENGLGKCEELQMESKCLARLYTYGKAMGCHGAAIVGSKELSEYLVNFSRSFIYTTALPDEAFAKIDSAYTALNNSDLRKRLRENINYFTSHKDYTNYFNKSNSAIQTCFVSGNKEVDELERKFISREIYCKAVKSPTVPIGKERIRFCIHAFNLKEEIDQIFEVLNEQ